MDTNAVLDVIIGLVLMYLLISLICTMCNEFIATWLKLRSSNLRKGIENLIDDQGLQKAFQNTALIKTAAQMSGGRGPSYLPSGTFTLALLDALKPENSVAKLATVDDVVGAIEQLPESNIKNSLLSVTQGAINDVEDARKRIGIWFDDMMDRAGGIYKRRLQTISLLVGLALAVALNADTIGVAKTLWADQALRTSIAESAVTFVDEADYVDDLLDLDVVQAELRPFPIGWDYTSPPFATDWYNNPLGILLKIAGLLLTAAAVSLGAPFWFDLLSKFVKIRAAGKAPKREEAA